MASPILKQNLYNGVYEDVKPNELPKELDLFNIDEKKFPLLKNEERHILAGEISTGDCIYLPSRSWY